MTLSRYAWLYLGSLALLAIIQISLGADIFLLSALVLVGATAVIPLSIRNMLIADALYFAFCLYNSIFSLAIKCFALQPVQSNLFTPRQSAAYLLLGSISTLIGYLFSRSFYNSPSYYRNIQNFFNDENVEHILAKGTFAIGAIFYYLQTAFRSQAVNGDFAEGGFGGFGAFYPLLVLGAVLQTALYVKRPRSRVEITTLIIMGITVLLLSLAGNVKKTLFDFLLVLITFYFSYRLTIKPRYIIGAATALFLMFAYVSPAIHIVRSNTNLNSVDRLIATWDVLSDSHFDASDLSEQEDKISIGYVVSYSGSYVYPYPWNTERFTLILPIDQVVRVLPQVGTMGMPYVLQDIAETVLPSIFISKELIAPNDRIAWHFGFRNNGTITRPVVGLIAGAAASYGLIGVVFLPGLATWVIFSIFNLIGGRLTGNPWGIFIFVSTIELIEKEAGTFVIFFARNFPLILIVAAVFMIMFRNRMSSTQQMRRITKRT